VAARCKAPVWDCGFESRQGIDICLLGVMSCRGLCDELITLVKGVLQDVSESVTEETETGGQGPLGLLSCEIRLV
jgi:hypothetical protein